MSNYYKYATENPGPGIFSMVHHYYGIMNYGPGIIMSTQCFSHVEAFWGALEAITKRNTFNHVSLIQK